MECPTRNGKKNFKNNSLLIIFKIEKKTRNHKFNSVTLCFKNLEINHDNISIKREKR